MSLTRCLREEIPQNTRKILIYTLTDSPRCANILSDCLLGCLTSQVLSGIMNPPTIKQERRESSMWVRKRIDIGWSDITCGLMRTCQPGGRKRISQRIEQRWSANGDAFACFSVRSGFDLLFDALDWHDGEVLMSAMTIHDMVRIVEHHGLTPVPVDLDLDSLAPDVDLLRQAITPQTRAIVVAHLFGSRVPLEPIAELAREHGLLLIEDCAQAFIGKDYIGDELADVSMFSFGPIKTGTALGGAVFRVHDAELLDRMRELQDQYRVQRRFTYFRRLLKYAAIKITASRVIMGALARGYRLAGSNHDSMINGLVRGFAGPDFFERIRRRPSTPLLAMLDRRLSRFREKTMHQRIERGNALKQLLANRVTCAGEDALDHSYWVFPIVVDNPDQLCERLWRAGFDASRRSSMIVVSPATENDEDLAHDALELSERMVYLPFYPQMSMRAIQRMAKIIVEECGQPDRKSSPPKVTRRRDNLLREDRRRRLWRPRLRRHPRPHDDSRNHPRKTRWRRMKEWMRRRSRVA